MKKQNLCGIVISSLLTAQIGMAGTITVTNIADSGPGTLRTALATANSGDVISFSLPTPAIIKLAGELFVTKSVSIVGPGPSSLAVDGNATNRVFGIFSSNTVTIANLTITNGFALGGGILNDHSDLTVSNCVLIGNSGVVAGGAIYSSGEVPETWGTASLKILNSSLSSNVVVPSLIGGSAGGGGAIYNTGASLIIRNSSLNGNSTDDTPGAGIYNTSGVGGGSASLEIVNCTLADNSAETEGGLDGGGAIFNIGNASVRILNSTLSDNVGWIDGSEIYTWGGTLQVFNCTLSGTAPVAEGSMIFNYNGSVQIGGNILHTTLSKTIAGFGVGVIVSLGYNLSSDGGGGFLSANGDQINTDPLLGPLQDNGGPTFTRAPLPGSPTMDRGKNLSGLTTDQRGLPRTVDDPATINASGGDGTDIGAVETKVPSPSEALAALIKTIEDSDLPLNRQRPLVSSLEAALAALDRANTTAALNQLSGFQNKISAQVAPSNPTLANELSTAAQQIIAVVGGP